ncbi:MAG: hypothetical protein DMF22_11505 [Verrucomicrobia bacterium]|nr:MAG: hypothetical protein DME81_07985 [Verrucomicrobiota bacterium]PYJ53807.1 MAG: hypothetical protein DME83_01605 [Verrucomicrobiota bacterium]PYL69283.1 MAG: hypothetical protein DMF22_11505 [Verrucomicrobiota bacterium]
MDDCAWVRIFLHATNLALKEAFQQSWARHALDSENRMRKIEANKQREHRLPPKRDCVFAEFG